MEKKNRAHVLLLPFPSQGHITPMIPLCKRLVSKGVKATLVTTVYAAKSLQADIEIATISDGYDHGGYAVAESIEAYKASLKLVGSQTLASLIHKLGDLGHPVNALVYDGAIPWALEVAKQFGLLKVMFFSQSCAVSSVYYHVHRGLVEFPLSGPVLSLPGLPPLGRSDVPSNIDDPVSYPVFLKAVLGQFDNIDEADWLLQNTFYELEQEVIDSMPKFGRLRTVGPLVPSMYLDKRLEDDKQYGIHLFTLISTEACKKWLNSKPRGSVVYVSMGSLATLNSEQMEEMACALKGSDHYFLWVVREAEQAKLPHNFAEDTSHKGLVVGWCHQLEVLAHESIGCFVTHCGFNSTLEALSLGVPMVAVPQWTDQCTNAKFVEDVWGIGVKAWPDEKGVLRRQEIELRIAEVMEGEKGKVIKKNSIKWMKLAKEAVDLGGSSDKNIDEFVANLVC